MRWKSGTNTIGQWASLRGPGSKQLVPGLQDGNVPPSFPDRVSRIFPHPVFPTIV